jgi:hypothetical protein
MSVRQIWDLYFGYPSGAVYSNLIASVICVGMAWWRLRAQNVRQHVQAMALQARHHAERAEQADRHHEAQMELLRRQHSQVLDAAPAAAKRTAAKPGERI